MNLSTQDRVSFQEAIGKVWDAATDCLEPADLDEARKRLQTCRDAILNAGHVINTLEEKTRQQAFVDLSERIQQQVGMEPESL